VSRAARPIVPHSREALLVVAAMIVALPLVAIQGPLHTTPMDAVNIPFVGLCWCVILARRERMALPLVLPVWLIFVGSCMGLYSADYYRRAFVVIVEDLYLYVWFITLSHFLVRRCRLDEVAMIWIAVACSVALGTFADAHWHLLGGRLAGDAARATGTFENPNMFGDYLVVSFFVAWATAAAGPRYLYLALPVLLNGILATHSNGALVSLLGGTSIVVAMQPVIWKPRYVGALLVVGAVVLGVVGVWHDQLKEMAMARFSGGRSEVGGAALKGADERIPVWLDAAHDVMETPTGVGPGNFNRDGGAISGDTHAAHSEYVGMLTERSVVGLAGWCGVLVGIFAMIRRIGAAAAAGFRPFGVAQLYGLLAAIAAHALVIELSHFRHIWLVFALVASAAAQASPFLVPRAAPVVFVRRRVLEETA